MKSFSIKTLALAFAVVAGSANAYPGDRLVNGTCKAINNVFAKISKPYAEELCDHLYVNLIVDKYTSEETAEKIHNIVMFPYNHHYISRTIFALGVAAAAYKTYKHFTKPAADATVEGENVEANETTVEVA